MELTAAEAHQLDAALDDALDRYAGPLAGPCNRIVHSPGRRLRPALTLACARVGGDLFDSTTTIRLAAAVELLHAATLVHDDVIDGALTRRGVETVNAREGLGTAIVAGDALIAASLGLAGEIDPVAGAILTRTLADLCAGQAAEERLRFDLSASVAAVIDAAALKTGSLLRAACAVGAVAGRLDGDLGEALADYGMAFGVCLQMVDDVLDVVSTPTLLGKPVGADIGAGVMSLPVVCCLETRPGLGPLIGSPADTPAGEQALTLVRHSGAINSTVRRARTHAAWSAARLREAAPSRADVSALATCAGDFVEHQLRTKTHPRWSSLVLYRPELEASSS